MRLEKSARFSLLLVAALYGFAVGTGSAAAQTDKALATELFNQGRDLLKEERYEEACPKLEESARLDAKVGTLVNLAKCEEGLNHLVAARAILQRAVNLAASVGDDRVELVKGELDRVDRMVPKMKLALEPPVPSDMEVSVGDTKLRGDALQLAIPLDVGTHVVVATADGYERYETTVELTGQGTVTKISIPPLTALPPGATPGRPSSSPLPTIGYVVGGVGVVGLAVGAITGIMVLDKKSTVDDSCTDNVCNDEGLAANEDGKSLAPVSSIGLIAGGVLVAAGVTLIVIGSSSDEGESTGRIWLQPRVATDGLGASVVGTF